MDLKLMGDKFKAREEMYRTRFPKDAYVIIRLDGRAFHSYTKGLKRPYDLDLMEDMDNSMLNLMDDLQNAKFAYTQSDEISVLLTAWREGTTGYQFERSELMFGGQLQKLVTIAASSVSSTMNISRYDENEDKVALFDARAFPLFTKREVKDYFIWRQKDCQKNAISMAAHTVASHKELLGKNTAERAEIAKGVELPDGFRNGRIAYDEPYFATNIEYMDKRSGELNTTSAWRSKLSKEDAPDFSKTDVLDKYIPEHVV